MKPTRAIIAFLILAVAILLTSCTVSESLTTPNADDRRIIGYKSGIIFKKRKYYKVVDGHGHKAPRIFEPEELKPIGTILIHEF